MSGAVEDSLLEALEDLDRSDLERFLWKLSKLPVRRRYKKIPRGRLENANLFRVVDLLLKFYTEEYAPRVTVRVLKGIHCMQQAESLKEALEIDTSSSESSDSSENDDSSDSESDDDDDPEEDDAIKKSDSPKATAGQNSAFRTQGQKKLQQGAGSQGATARGNGKETQGKKEDVSEKADSSDSESDDDDDPEEDDAIKKSDSPKATAGQNSAFRTQGLEKLKQGARSEGATARGNGKETQGKKEDVSEKADASSSESDDDDDNSGSESDDDNDSPEEDDAIKKSDSPKVTAGQNSAFRTQGQKKLQQGAGSQGATARGNGKKTQGKKEDVSENADASSSESDDDDDTSGSESSDNAGSEKD